MADSRFILAPRSARFPMADAPNVARRPPRHSWIGRWFDDWWLGEILALAFSSSLVVGLCLLLRTYQGAQLPRFGSFLGSGITLNTIVALLATLSVAASLVVVEACLSQLKWLWYRQSTRPLTDLDVYDRASRGTWGSLQLFWKLPLRLLPSIGALLMISSLAIAPLAQQSVRTVRQNVTADDGIAAVGVNDFWIVNDPTENTQQTSGFNRINATTKGAVMTGIFYDNDTIPELAPVCTSGNCTFDSYHSLAICSWVADVSSHLANTTVSATSSQQPGNATWCLPGDLCISVNGTYPIIANVLSANGSGGGVSWQPQDVNLWLLNYTSVAFEDHPQPITDNYIIYQNTTYPGFREGRPNEELVYSAFEFIFDWCVPTFQTTVVNGSATTIRLPDPVSSFELPPGLQPLNAVVNNVTYGVDQFTHDALQRYFWEFLDGFIVPVPQPGIDVTTTNSDAAQVLWASTQRNRIETWSNGTNQIATQADALATLQSILNNTAISMSNLVRKQSSVPPFRGTMTVEESVVVVDWSYAIALVVFDAVVLVFFLAVAFIHTRPLRSGLQTPVWKSSTYAVLHSLDPQTHNALASATRTSEIESEAALLHVRLVPDGDSWRLVAGDDLDGTSDHIPLRGMPRWNGVPNESKLGSFATVSEI